MTFKDRVRSLPIVGNLVQNLYWRLRGTYRTKPAYWLARIFTQPEVTVVQIGSNDGLTGDPLHHLLLRRKQWSALLVEPVPYLFARLQKNYPPIPRFRFENSVVNDGSVVTFYWVAEEAKNSFSDLPPWYDELGSFDRHHILKHLPKLEPFIREAKLPGITLEKLFEKHGINSLDLLHIDTEGADLKILSQLDFDKHLPTAILYERRHLSEGDAKAAVQFLQSHYVLYNLGPDVLAVERKTNERLGPKLEKLRRRKVTDF